MRQLFAQCGGRELQIFGAANERSGDGRDQFRPLLARQPLAAILFQRLIDEVLKHLRIGFDPVGGGIFEDLRGDALVNDLEVFRQTQQGRALAQNVVGQAVQRADAIAHVGQQRSIGLIEKAANAPREVIDRRIGKGDDQHFFFAVNLSCTRRAAR